MSICGRRHTFPERGLRRKAPPQLAFLLHGPKAHVPREGFETLPDRPDDAPGVQAEGTRSPRGV